MIFRIGVIGQIGLDSRAHGIAAYLRSFFKYTDGLESVYWGGEVSERRRCGENWVVCKPIGFAGPRILPRRIATILALLRHRHEILSEADVLFVHNSEWVLPFALSTRRPPIVLVRHGWAPKEISKTRGWLQYVWIQAADYLAANIASKTIVVSKEGYEGFRQRYRAIADKFEYIPTFIDDEMLLSAPTRSEGRSALDCAENDLMLLVVARLVPEKQIDKAIQVLAAVRKQQPKARLWIVGDGPEEQNLRALAKTLFVEDAVSFHGAVSHDRVSQYFAAADFLLLLSQWEGTSITLLEALNFGLPAIVTDVADHRSFIIDNVNGKVVSRTWAVEEATEWLLRLGESGPFPPVAVPYADGAYLASRLVPIIVERLRQVGRSAQGLTNEVKS